MFVGYAAIRRRLKPQAVPCQFLWTVPEKPSAVARRLRLTSRASRVKQFNEHDVSESEKFSDDHLIEDIEVGAMEVVSCDTECSSSVDKEVQTSDTRFSSVTHCAIHRHTLQHIDLLHLV